MNEVVDSFLLVLAVVAFFVVVAVITVAQL